MKVAEKEGVLRQFKDENAALKEQISQGELKVSSMNRLDTAIELHLRVSQIVFQFWLLLADQLVLHNHS